MVLRGVGGVALATFGDRVRGGAAGEDSLAVGDVPLLPTLLGPLLLGGAVGEYTLLLLWEHPLLLGGAVGEFGVIKSRLELLLLVS